MSLSPSAQRAIEWLEQQLADLAGIRNATPRDPSFKNWRQSSLTTLQRIWPGDQERSERFRRIPFSPVDPRADARVIREWYSRGCQEAARVLNGFIEDVSQNGVPEQPAELATSEMGSDFEDDFPTVDLPAGDLSGEATDSVVVSNMLSEFVDAAPQANAADAPAPPSLPSEIPAIQNAVAEVHAHETRQPRKGVGARLKDLLGFAQLSAKALAGFPRESAPPTSLPSLDAPVSASLPSMDVLPLGGVVSNESRQAAEPNVPLPIVPVGEETFLLAPDAHERAPNSPPALSISLPPAEAPPAGAPSAGNWPLPKPLESAAAVVPTPAIASPAPAPSAPAPPVAPASATPAPLTHEAGMSVVMSKPTTLRAAIEKVSIESLLSDQFRAPAPEEAPSSTAAPAPASPAAAPPSSAAPAIAPAASVAPASAPPVTVAPVTPPPAAVAPTSAPPVTVAPVTPPPAAVPLVSAHSVPAAPVMAPQGASDDTPQALEDMVNAMLTSSAEKLPPMPAEPVAASKAVSLEPVADVARSIPEPAPEVPVIPLFEQVRTAPAPAPRASAPAPAAVAPVASPHQEPRPVQSASTPTPAPTPSPEPIAATADLASEAEELGLPPIEAIEAELDSPSPAAPEAGGARFIQLPPRRRSPRADQTPAEDDSAVGKVDPDAFARATEDFMRSSPVLGATGRKVKRPEEETGFGDPDAIAVASMVQELGRLDVPAGRHAEVRARLLDLARRIEKGELEWTTLRKAVWFAMEYPEIARRLMPVLLPWIDHAA